MPFWTNCTLLCNQRGPEKMRKFFTANILLLTGILITGCSVQSLDIINSQNLHTDYRIVKNGCGQGKDMAVVIWRTKQGLQVGQVRLQINGPGTTGPISVILRDVGRRPYSHLTNPNYGSWDTREWQWWKGLAAELVNQDRPRNYSTTIGGADKGPGGRICPTPTRRTTKPASRSPS